MKSFSLIHGTGPAKRLAMASAAALFMSAALIAVPSAAHAAGCYAASCTGKDPVAEGCTGATTVLSNSAEGGQFVIELRYSAACDAYWARATINEPSDDSGNDAIIYGWTCAPGCVSASEDSGVFASHQVYSNMITGSYWVQACTGFLVDSSQICTDIGGNGEGPR